MPLPVSGHVVSLLVEHIFFHTLGLIVGTCKFWQFSGHVYLFRLCFSFSSERPLSKRLFMIPVMDLVTLFDILSLSSKSFSSSASNSSSGHSREIQFSLSLSTSPSELVRIWPCVIPLFSGRRFSHARPGHYLFVTFMSLLRSRIPLRGRGLRAFLFAATRALRLCPFSSRLFVLAA